jgi:phosphate/phosphite/phosphonate ABC transporter binding protein
MKYYIFLILIILTGCSDSWTDPDKEVWINFNDTSANKSALATTGDSTNYLRIAVASMTTPAETFDRYNDLFEYMEKGLDREILLVQRKTYREVNDLLKANKIDMAFICSGAYVAGIADSAFNLFLLPERDNQRYYYAYIIVREDSPYESFLDLKGKKFVFPDSLSNTGMYYPLRRLHDYGSTSEEFFGETYLSNAHDNSIELVSRGIVDGASVNSLVFDYIKRTHPEMVMNLKIIEKSTHFGMPPLVVSRQIDSVLLKDLHSVLTNMVKYKEGRDILRSLMINRFVTDDDRLYDGIRQMCEGVCDRNNIKPMTPGKIYPLNKVRLPLFWKFAIAISIIVILFGTLNLLFIRYQVYRTFEAQIERNGLSIASMAAKQLVDPMLYNELGTVNKVLQRTKSVNPDIKYLIVVSPENLVIAHTFTDTPPQSLINANYLERDITSGIKIINSLSQRDTVIRDFAMPILDKRLGTLRVGFSEAIINQQLSQASRMFIVLVFGLLILGLVAAFFLSYIISMPVKNMSYQVSKINLRSIESRDYNINPQTGNIMLKLKNLFNMTDEIDVLGNSFNEMLFRLNVAYMELERTRESLSQTEKLASVGTLAAGLAHEINNPLAGMSNCLRRIADKPDNINQNKEYISMMSEAIDKISNVVKGLLDFSRKHEMNLRHMNLIQHIENSISLNKFPAQAVEYFS